jgi:hypothetical protein
MGKQQPSAIPVVEMVDLGDEAARLGLTCRVLMTPDLPRACGVLAVEKLRDALHATQEDPATLHFRAIALAGEKRRPEIGSPLELIAEGRRFLTRVRAGIGGVSDGGSMLALAIPSEGGVEMVVCVLWVLSVPEPGAGSLVGGPWGRDPMIILTAPDGIERVFEFSRAGALAHPSR